MVQGTCCVFLGLAVMQACGDQVVPGARNAAKVWRLGHYYGGLSQQWQGVFVGISASRTAVGIGIFLHAQERCDANLRGPGGSSSQAVAEIGGDGARARLPNGSVSCGPHNGSLPTATAAHRVFPADADV